MKIFRLKEILTQKGISGKEFSKSVGVTEATISNLVQGESIPRKDLLIKIATNLEIDIRDLFVSRYGRKKSKEELIREAIALLQKADSMNDMILK